MKANSKMITPFLLLLFILGCSSNKSQVAVKEKFSPGTAVIIASFNNIKPDGMNIIVELTASKIIGYGAASSPISSNSKLSALAIIDGVKDSLTKYKNDDSIVVELKLLQSGVNKQNSVKWEILSITKNN